MKSVNILGMEVDDISIDDAVSLAKNFIEDDYQHYIVTPNPEIVLLAMKSNSLRFILNHADISLPDGFGLVVASLILGDRLSNRVPGSDFSEALLLLASDNRYPVFILGSESEKNLGLARENLLKKFPNLEISGFETGGIVKLENNICESSDLDLVEKIKSSGAKILFVGFGCPKQEKWIFQNLDKLPNIKLAIGVGGTIDFWAGKKKRANIFFKKFGIEWIWRLAIEPKRWKRILNAVFVFLFTVIFWKIRSVFFYRKNAAAFIINEKRQVLLIKRADSQEDHWQLPQGGIDKKEDASCAAAREAKEETGLENLEPIGQCSNIYVYEWPTKWHKLNAGYKGQEQTIVYFKNSGEDTDVVVDKNEASSFEWVDIEKAVDKIFPKRRVMAKMAVEGFYELERENKITN